VTRTDGYSPIRDYAAIGDGRTVALVASDGSIDWLAVPRLDGVTVFGALVDAQRGGAFELTPVDEYQVERRYLPSSNVLETTFTTEQGVARVTDGLLLQDGGQLSWIELARRIEGVKGNVRFRYRLRPSFDFGRLEHTIERLDDVMLARAGRRVLVFRTWDTAEAQHTATTIEGELETSRKSNALLVCVIVENEPIPLPPREEIETRFDRTVDAWERWANFHDWNGAFQEAVERSTLALKLLINSETGAMAAAPTTSLPEKIGGDANWDYRFAWVRDTAFTLDALGNLGYREQVHASLAWLLAATEASHPRLGPFYTLDGKVSDNVECLELEGYRGSRPVRSGNGASGQVQLGSYGDLLETIWLYVRNGNLIDEHTAIRVAEVADHVCRIWENDDSGIWELDDLRPYTQSKINCWLALDRAIRLHERGDAPGREVARWRETRDAIRRFVDEHCWSDAKQSYTFYAGTDDLDAAVLLAARCGFLEDGDPRLGPTIDAIRRELGAGGPLLYRYSGQRSKEGAFLACSFWLVSALVTDERIDDARQTMEELLALSNDVGLYAEEIDPETKEFLGNFPQGLTHLALINAAAAIAAGDKEEDQ
jgi:GH15 family glucan-1,4-alpha-glucosidase